MPRSEWSRSGRTQIVRQEFSWSTNTINAFLVLVLATAGVLIGVFSVFIQIQNTMQLGVPWLFPYGVSVGIITVIFVILIAILYNNNTLPPGVTIVICFILFVLYLIGLVETCIQLFGAGNVSSSCQSFVSGQKVFGPTVDTLAWLQQQNICQSWYAVFAFSLLGTIMYMLMMLYAMQIGSGALD